MLPTTACSHARLSNRLESTFLLPSHDRDGVVAAFFSSLLETTMTPPDFLLLVVMILAQATAFADGGTVQLRTEAGPLVITVFSSPAPLSAGPVDISLLLQNRTGLEPVLDATVSLALRADTSGTEIRARPTREQAQNKLLYAAPVTLTESGKWRLAVTILRNGERTDATGTIDVAPAPEMAASYWGYIAFPPLMIVGFVVREWLLRRRLELRV